MDALDTLKMAYPKTTKKRQRNWRQCAASSDRSEINTMKTTQLLQNLGQSLWLDNITRDLLNNGTLKRYIDELSVTGLTSNPTIFDHTSRAVTAYDTAIREGLAKGRAGEVLFFDLALDDLTRAPTSRPVHDGTNGVDGWVSLEVSPLLAHETAKTVAPPGTLCAGGTPNLFIKIPGTKEGLPAIEEAIFAGVPVKRNVAVFARAVRGSGRGVFARHRTAYCRRAQIPRSAPWPRCSSAAGMPPLLQGPGDLEQPARHSRCRPHLQGVPRPVEHPRWQRAYNLGARPQRLLWASTGTKDPKASTFSTSKPSLPLSP